MPKMYLYTLRKPDGELVYVLKPYDENSENSEIIQDGSKEHVAEMASEELETREEIDEERITDADFDMDYPEEIADNVAKLRDGMGHVFTDNLCQDQSVDIGITTEREDRLQTTEPPSWSKRIQIIEQPAVGTALLPLEEGQPVVIPAGIMAIPRDTWESLLPTEEKDTLKNGWTDVVSKAYSVVNPYCVLAFQHSYLGRPRSLNLKMRMWRATARCKHAHCINVEFSLNEYSAQADDVPLHFKATGSYNHRPGEIQRRFIRGVERQRVLQDLKCLPPSAVKEKLMGSADKNVLTAGNHSSCPTLQTIQKIASDGRKKEERDTDMWLDLDAMCQEKNPAIRVLSRLPFILAWHTKEQIQFLKTCGERELYVGCTGHLVRAMRNLPVYYYALIVRPGVGKPEFPIAEMLTDSNRYPTVSYWLSIVTDDIKELASLDICDGGTKIVIDGGEVLRDAAAWAFTGTHINRYLGCRMEAGIPVSPSMHLCGVQEIHAAMEAALKMPHTIEGRQTALRVIRALQMSTTLEEALVIFKWASVVFNQRFVTQKVSVAIINLERAISRVVIEGLDIASEPHKHAKVVVPEIYALASKPNESPYYRAFVLSQLSSTQFQGVTEYENALFIPGFTDYLLQAHLPYYPLWSNGSRDCRLADCVTEKWFHYVHMEILKRQKHLKPGRFFRLQVELVASTMREAQKERLTNSRMLQVLGAYESRRKKPTASALSASWSLYGMFIMKLRLALIRTFDEGILDTQTPLVLKHISM